MNIKANDILNDFQKLSMKVMKYKGGCDKCINGADYNKAFELLNIMKKESYGGCGCNINQNGGIKRKINTRRKKK
jgi:hypothetical protein